MNLLGFSLAGLHGVPFKQIEKEKRVISKTRHAGSDRSTLLLLLLLLLLLASRFRQ